MQIWEVNFTIKKINKSKFISYICCYKYVKTKIIQMKNKEERKIVQVDWSQELQDELKKDIEKLNDDFNLEKLEQLIKDETENDKNP